LLTAEVSVKPTSRTRLVQYSSSSSGICCESGYFSTSDGTCKCQYAPIKFQVYVLKDKKIRASNQLFDMVTKIIISRNGWTVSDEVYSIDMRYKVRIQNGQCSETEQVIEMVQYSVRATVKSSTSRCSACNL